MPNKKIKLSRRFEGEVVHVGHKTASVLVAVMRLDAKYKKRFALTKKYPIHDENEIAKVGDRVLIEECRPISKTKKWNLVSVKDRFALGGKVI